MNVGFHRVGMHVFENASRNLVFLGRRENGGEESQRGDAGVRDDERARKAQVAHMAKQFRDSAGAGQNGGGDAPAAGKIHVTFSQKTGIVPSRSRPH